MPLDAYNARVANARAVPIEREVERRGIKLRRSGDELIGPCPKCGGDDRFAINIAKQVFNCRGCEAGGDVIALVEHLDGVDFSHACTTLTGVPRPNGQRYYPADKEAVVATFEYHDESGAVAYVISRIQFQAGNGVFVLGKDGKPKKKFSQRRPDPDRAGGWIYNVEGVTKIPYRLPELIEAAASQQLISLSKARARPTRLPGSA